MSKPKTSYSPVAKPKTSYSHVAKPTTSFDRTGGSAQSLLLNSSTVQLNSTVYLLSGYTGATPNQLSTKPKTSYTAV